MNLPTPDSLGVMDDGERSFLVVPIPREDAKRLAVGLVRKGSKLTRGDIAAAMRNAAMLVVVSEELRRA